MLGMAIAGSDGISPAFLGLLEVEPLARLCGLDVGTGRGRLALALALRCRRVVGIDVDARAIEEARQQAGRLGLANVQFMVADAEAIEYTAFAPDVVVAHLCMSDAIAERAARAVGLGRAFAFVAFHADQWRETGRPSRFAYDERQIRALLEGLGFAVEHLEVEREVRTFGSVEEALAAVVAFEDRWRQDGRWFGYLKYLEDGGRQLTRSHLMVKARRR
jgi:SAM-dependent methyltransferase